VARVGRVVIEAVVAVDALLVLRGEVAVDGDVGCVLMVALP
jgi:hypothetical protein